MTTSAVITKAFAGIRPTPVEIRSSRTGDDLIPAADVVMDRGFTVDAAVEAVWPWVQQLGKHRAGWYLPRSVERFIPRSRRAIRSIDPQWQHLAVGDVIPDYVSQPSRRRLRVSDYRVIYTVEGERLIVWVVQVGHRSTTY